MKDDDYLESFKYGNFITLTNLNDKNIDNIIKYSLSPLYVSFHSSDDNIRNTLFGSKSNKKAADILRIFDLNNIKVHIQIVLCPGINDKEDLLKTIEFLNINFKNIESIGIVPVGITGYNKNPMLSSFKRKNSIDLIDMINNFSALKKYKNIFLSDEFYILSGNNFPEYNSYGDFGQIENGIGLCRNFIYELDCCLKNIINKKICDINGFSENSSLLSENSPGEIKKVFSKNILILTSEYFYETMAAQSEKIKKILEEKTLNLNLNLKVDYLKNYFLGGNVKVAGLMTFYDFICWYNDPSDLSKKEFGKYDKILIPDVIFNSDGLTLDNKVKNDFLDIFKNICFVEPSGKSILKEIL